MISFKHFKFVLIIRIYLYFLLGLDKFHYNFYRVELQEMEQLRKKYHAQADLMAGKPRFGYFSILPSHTAGVTDYHKKIPHKTGDGRVQVESRNVFSGITSSGVVKKSYFSVPKSIYHGDPYEKPHNVSCNDLSSKNGQKEVFKPAKLNKTLAWPAYRYTCQNPPPKNPKINRRPDGGVIIQQRNICANPPSKINQQNLKKFTYTPSDYDNEKKTRNKQLMESIKKRRGQAPFRSGNPVKDCFSSNKQAFNDHQIKKKQQSTSLINVKSVEHEAQFRPSCRSRSNLFSYPNHMSDEHPKVVKKKFPKQQQPLRLCNKKQSSKPCPSIAYSKINLLRSIR